MARCSFGVGTSNETAPLHSACWLSPHWCRSLGGHARCDAWPVKNRAELVVCGGAVMNGVSREGGRRGWHGRTSPWCPGPTRLLRIRLRWLRSRRCFVEAMLVATSDMSWLRLYNLRWHPPANANSWRPPRLWPGQRPPWPIAEVPDIQVTYGAARRPLSADDGPNHEKTRSPCTLCDDQA